MEKFKLISFHKDHLEITGNILKKDNELEIQYELFGDLSRLVIPSPAATRGLQDKLWETTCFELFLKAPIFEDYVEFNFSVSGNWNILHFKNYREKNDRAKHYMTPVIIESEARKGYLSLKTKLYLLDLPFLANKQILAGISAVTETKDKQKNFWALKHAREKPDFHAPESFVLELK